MSENSGNGFFFMTTVVSVIYRTGVIFLKLPCAPGHTHICFKKSASAVICVAKHHKRLALLILIKTWPLILKILLVTNNHPSEPLKFLYIYIYICSNKGTSLRNYHDQSPGYLHQKLAICFVYIFIYFSCIIIRLVGVRQLNITYGDVTFEVYHCVFTVCVSITGACK